MQPMRVLYFLLAFLIGTLPGLAASLAQPAPGAVSSSVAGASTSDFNLPKLGLAGGAALPLWKAQFIGQTIYRELQGAEVVINDPLVAHYVNYLGHQLSSAADSPGEPFHYFALKAPVINAFALPGAYIAVFSRLILITRNEDELAGVMAHETAHIVQRHTARRMADATYNTLVNLGILLGGLIAAAAGAGIGAVIAAQGGIIQRQINYTRADEFEADRVGIGILARAGFDPKGMIGFFQYMQRNYAMQGYNTPEFLSTHPLDLTRITEAQMRAKSMHVTLRPANPNYALMRARLRVLVSDDMAQTLDYFEARRNSLDDPWYRAAATYGMVLSLNRLGEGERALKLIKPLAQSHPNNVALQLAWAETLLAAGQNQAGLEALSDYNILFPSSPAVTLAYAQALMRAGQAKEVVALLSPGLHDRSYRYNPEFDQLLAKAADNAGRAALAYYAMAHYFLGRGQYRSASIQLRFGLELDDVPVVLRQQMEDMKKQVKEEYDRAVDMGIIRPKPGEPGPS
ncbi:MAG: M48 family metalloprotease [Gammaproteobacteria bacterium]|nr:M48 family metalloprotease [Gammaproteobacteria bacterium]